MKKQPLASQIGEIEFRRKLLRQQINGENLLDDEFDPEDIQRVLRERMTTTFTDMQSLRERGITLSPYVEIGAERCQRSLVMEDDLHLRGAAADISFDMLKSCDYYGGVFGKTQTPLRICCDVNNLPFISGSVPFVFCYETLHHFPEPSPIVKEIHRVLAPGGHFFFSEEPYKQVLHLNLYKGSRSHSTKTSFGLKFRKVFDWFLAQPACNEVEHGIIENFNITLDMWKQALSPFANTEIILKSRKGLTSELFHPRNVIKRYLAYLLGGEIAGLCRKAGERGGYNAPILEILCCPSCNEAGREIQLKRKDQNFLCNECHGSYPIVEGVAFVISHGKLKELYPEVYKNIG